MYYSFPHIKHIDDVLPHIKGRDEFVVVKKDGYTVINYVFATNDTFPPVWEGDTDEDIRLNPDAMMLRECRGLTFYEDGTIAQRKFHKFFNVGEKTETLQENIAWSQSHVILEKLDGSMITPLMLNDHLRWTTKMGITDVAFSVEEFVETQPVYKQFAKDCIRLAMTPIFEWCSNKQRIVIDHPEDRLVLTAIRENVNGRYVGYDRMNDMVRGYDGIPVVKAFDWDIAYDVQQFLDYTRELKDTEGFVVRFDNGHMVKIKADDYVRLHRTKDAISTERRLLDLILNGNLDDLKPLMSPEDFEKVVKYEGDFRQAIFEVNLKILDLYEWCLFENVDRKSFALNIAKTIHPMHAAFVFKQWDGPDGWDLYGQIIEKIKQSLGSTKSFDAVKSAFFPDVKYGDVECA